MSGNMRMQFSRLSEIVAYHEAGHATAAVVLGGPIEDAYLCNGVEDRAIDPTGGCSCDTRTWLRHGGLHFAIAQFQLAGYAGERLLLGAELERDETDDYSRALELLVARTVPGNAYRREWLHNATYAESCPELVRAYSAACQLIEEHSYGVHRIAAELLPGQRVFNHRLRYLVFGCEEPGCDTDQAVLHSQPELKAQGWQRTPSGWCCPKHSHLAGEEN
jgi:hypothetical protein